MEKTYFYRTKPVKYPYLSLYKGFIYTFARVHIDFFAASKYSKISTKKEGVCLTLTELSVALGIDIPAERFAAYSPIPDGRRDALCTLSLIERLEERFGLFGDYYEDVKAGFEAIERDPARREYMDMLSLYILDRDMPDTGTLPYPPYVGTPASAMLPLLVHLPSIERLYDSMRKRGFTHEEAKTTLSVYRQYMREEKLYRGGFVGVSGGISNWMAYFTKGHFFYPGYAGLNFHLTNIAHNDPYFLRNRRTGEVIAVCGELQTFHRSGLVLGSAGAEDEEGAFTALFEETDDAYIGNPVRHYRTLRERERFPKTDWELALKPLDRVLGTHIFFDADLSPEQVDIALREARRMGEQYFPECGFKGIYCSSWMMNPIVGEILGKQSKIDGFASRFMRYHKKSLANLYRSFVFPGKYDSDEQLPENTTLQRAFKKRLLEGGYIYETPGVIIY